MADIFLAYALPDRDRVSTLLALLRSLWTVWSVEDSLQPTDPIYDTVDKEVNAARCVLVLWSAASIDHDFVKRQALGGLQRKRLLTAFIEHVEPPSGFPRSGVDLTDWDGRLDHTGFEMLRVLVEQRIGPSSVISADVSGLPATSLDMKAGKVFLCYRREDTQDAAGRLYDRLTEAYGHDRVFMDIDSMPLGVNFVTYIAAQLQKCAALLAIIGRSWVTVTDSEGRRRLADPADHIRVELAAALTQGVPVIPVLVQNATMPRVTDLPEDIVPLAYQNGLRLAPEFWRAGVERLVEHLDTLMPVEAGVRRLRQTRPEATEILDETLPQEWRDLAARFRRFSGTNVRAEYSPLNHPGGSWEITGGTPLENRHMDALCRLAGVLLWRSGALRLSLMNRPEEQTDELQRWLDFLAVTYGLEDRRTVKRNGTDGELYDALVSARIKNLGDRSAVACLERAAADA